MKHNQVIEINPKEAIEAVKKVKGKVIHCFMGSFGADWNKKDVISLIKKSKRIAWADNMFNHNLCIINDGRLRCFDIKHS